MATTAATATVEVLTAEVRVLMVGSRQVTMGVARQLDQCEWDQLEPWGRISLRQGEDWLIGRHHKTGALVTHELLYRGKPSAPQKPKPWAEYWHHHQLWSGTDEERARVEYVRKMQEYQIDVDQYRDELEEWQAHREFREQAIRLPLIVLAGLR